MKWGRREERRNLSIQSIFSKGWWRIVQESESSFIYWTIAGGITGHFPPFLVCGKRRQKVRTKKRGEEEKEEKVKNKKKKKRQ